MCYFFGLKISTNHLTIRRPSSPSHNRLPVSVYNLFFDQSKFVSEKRFNEFQDSTTSKLQEFQDFQ